MNAALSFAENKEQIIFATPLGQELGNSNTQGVGSIPDAKQTPEVTAKQVTPAVVYDRAADVGQVLQTKADVPKGDINFACTSFADTMKETMTGLFGALSSKEPETTTPAPELQVAMQPPKPQVTPFGL